MEIDMAPMRCSPSVIMKKEPFWKKVDWMKKFRLVPELTVLFTRSSGSFHISLSYANSYGLGYLELLLLCACPQLRLVLQVARLCPQTIAAARAPKSVPLYEYLTYLTAFLSTSVPAWANWLLSLVTDAYTFTSHFLLSPVTNEQDHGGQLVHYRCLVRIISI